MKRLLFVCTGNICRSPMAQYLLQHMLEKEKIRGYRTISAGVDALKGLPATHKVVDLLDQEGIDCGKHRSQPLTKELLDSSHLILVMTSYHKSRVLQIGGEGKVHRLKEYVLGENREESLDIADPYGGTLLDYEISLKEIRSSLEKLMLVLKGL